MAEDGTKAKDKKFFWLRLKRDFFKRHDIRVIESMPNGKDYILFYLKLLCESVDHEGRLRFSEEIPYNADMLATITNTNVDIVKSAIKVFTQLHMMELLDDGTFFMQEVQKMIGSETYWAERKRIQRAKEEGKLMITAGQQETANDEIGQFPTESNVSPTCPSKSKSYIENNSYIKSNIYNPPIIPPTGETETEVEPNRNQTETKQEPKRNRHTFTPPTIEEVDEYCRSRNNSIDAEEFVAFYESKNWMVGKNKMASWKAAVITWEKTERKKTKSSGRDWDNL